MASTERVTVTLPAGLVERIDRLESNRSRFIAEAVERELIARRREALLQSLQNPHAEADDAAEEDLRHWVSDLPPEDDALLDPAAGKAVRWVEGKGWIEESP